MTTVPTRHNGTEEERLALDLLIKLTRASDAVCNRVHQHLIGTNLSVTQFGILDALHHIGPMSLGDLAKKHLKSPNNITSVVDTMERTGLVKRVRHEIDRRVILLHITDKGRELFEKHWPSHVESVVRAASVLSPAEQRTLAHLLRQFGMGA